MKNNKPLRELKKEFKSLLKESEMDQRNAAISQSESISHLNRIQELERKLKKAEETLMFIKDECDWEEGTNHGSCDMCYTSGDQRIGEAIVIVLNQIREI